MKRRLLLIIILLILLPVVVLVCLSIGDVVTNILNMLGQDRTIVLDVRLPRILGALVVGAGLAVCGCVLQAILRNPLADPYTLGISGGAAVGVTIAMIVQPIAQLAGRLGYLSQPIAAFAGAIMAVLLVFLIASRHRFSVSGLVLGGVILSFIFSGVVLLLFTIARPTEIQSTMFWLMGSLSAVNNNMLKVVTPFVIVGILIVIIFARDLDVMTMGDEKAVHLGVSATGLRQLMFIVTSLITAACVAISGVIGFIGLMIPHIMRLIIGPGHRALIIASVLSGAIFLVVADTIARTIIAPTELPVGVITGIVGGIFFIVLLMRKTV